MRIEGDIADALLAKAEAAVDAPGRSGLVSEALRSLIYRQTARRPIAPGGSDPNAALAPRRRSD